LSPAHSPGKVTREPSAEHCQNHKKSKEISMFTTRPELLGTFGMVSTTHWIASAAGMAMLEKGGNAFDAAVCAGFVLHIVEPHLNGPGGDMPAIIHVAGEDRPRVICGQGVAPAGATMAYYRDELGLDLSMAGY
jgi:gamma-glutamyltranspeptidase/glutathione hydrolase